MQIFKRLSIKQNVFIVFAVSLAVITAIVAIGARGMHQTRKSVKEIYSETFREARMLSVLDRDFEKSRRLLLAMSHERDSELWHAHINEINATTHDIDNTIGRMISMNSHFDPEARSHIERLRDLWIDFKATRDGEIIPAIVKGKSAYALKLATDVQSLRFNEFKSISESLAMHENDEIMSAQKRIDAGFRKTLILFLVISASGLLVITPTLAYFSRDIKERLRIIVEAITRVKSGDLDFKISDEGKDEIGYVTSNLNKMIRQLYEDRIMQDQSMAILQWYSDESAKEVEKLAKLNVALTQTQEELNTKNRNLEESLAEITRMNHVLAETKAQMIQSEKMSSIGQLAAGVAHEINTPIGFISSNLNTLDGYITDMRNLYRLKRELITAVNEGKTEETAVIIDKIERYSAEIDIAFIESDIKSLLAESKEGIDRVASIVAGLKDFSHAGGGVAYECDLNQNLDNAVRLCWHELKYKIDVEKAYGEIPLIACQSQRLTQVFVNLIMNAAQAMPEKGKITIETREEGPDIIINISDTGAGMPDEVKDRIFEPFFTTKPVGKGTGLGLSIVYGIITDHKGQIDVESVPGKGTTFSIRLPIQQNEIEQVA